MIGLQQKFAKIRIFVDLFIKYGKDILYVNFFR